MKINANFEGYSAAQIINLPQEEEKDIEKCLLDFMNAPMDGIVDVAVQEIIPGLKSQIAQIAISRDEALTFSSKFNIKGEIYKGIILRLNELDLSPEGLAAAFHLLGTMEASFEELFTLKFKDKVQNIVQEEFARHGLNAGVFMAKGPAGKKEIEAIAEAFKKFRQSAEGPWPGSPKAEA